MVVWPRGISLYLTHHRKIVAKPTYYVRVDTIITDLFKEQKFSYKFRVTFLINLFHKAPFPLHA